MGVAEVGVVLCVEGGREGGGEGGRGGGGREGEGGKRRGREGERFVLICTCMLSW